MKLRAARDLAVRIATVLLLATGVNLAQTPAAPAFEVASIKPSPPGDPSNPLSGFPMLMPQPGGRLVATNTPLWLLISTAWSLPDDRIAGGNKDVMNIRYDITARAATDATLTQKELQPMLRALLIERFRLKTHIESREMPVYDLVRALGDGRLGPDLKPSKSDCSNIDDLNAKRTEAVARGDFAAIMPKPGEFLSCSLSPNFAGGPTRMALHGDGQEMKTLAELLAQFTGRYVRDKTGLTGRYDFDLRLDPQIQLALAQKLGINLPGGALQQADGSSLMTALREQLGLKLESSRGPVEVLVIDNVETPSPN